MLPTSTASKVSASSMVLIDTPSSGHEAEQQADEELDPLGQHCNRRRQRSGIHHAEGEGDKDPPQVGDADRERRVKGLAQRPTARGETEVEEGTGGAEPEDQNVG